MKNYMPNSTFTIFTFLFLISLSACSEEVKTTKRAPLPTEQKELDVLLKTTEISAAEAKEVNYQSETTINTMKVNGYSNFDYSEDSVSKLSLYINEISPRLPASIKEKMAVMWGSYLGNALIKNYQGSWVKMGDGSFAVYLTNGHYLFPMRRVYKQIENGYEDSILALFKSVDQINKNP
jgi:hypothetical protein